MLPLLAPNSGQKLLAILPDDERAHVQKTCQQLRLNAEFTDTFNARIRDYRSYHTILVGTNRMDYFGKPELQVPEAFQPIVDFVAGGGHLIMFGTYHGRNMEHLQRFGIQTEAAGGSEFSRVPVTSEALFSGSEKFVPKDNSLTFLGGFSIERSHVVMLNRRDGQPAIATLAFGNGRVTIMMVEPHFKNDFWLYNVILSWQVRGAPTRLLDYSMLRLDGSGGGASRRNLPESPEMTAAQETVKNSYADGFRQLKPWSSAVARELARKLLEDALKASGSALTYAMLTEAVNLAEKSGDPATVLNATEIASQLYQIDALSMLRDGLSQTVSSCELAGDCRTMAEVSILGASEALKIKRLEIADDLLELASGCARRARVPTLPKQISAMKRKVSDIRKAGDQPAKN